ncbi:MAG: division/cell wall cluster transcriptional repressor MraZ [Eubacteriales bacterium]|jgi:MraZ protein
MLLIGEYSHNVDSKGRMIMPSRFREILGETFIVTKGLDNCLYVYSMEEWKGLEDRIRTLPLSKARDLQRFFFAGAAVAEPDKQGRIILPANLRKYAGLDKDVVVTGASTHVEIWDKSRWEQQVESLTAESIEEAMEAIGF